MPRHGAVVVGTDQPVLVVSGAKVGQGEGQYDLEVVGEHEVYVGNADVSTSGATRGWSLKPGTRTRVGLTSQLWAVSADGPSEIVFFRSEG